MPPAAGFVDAHSSSHESVQSLDVFGNDLGDVDVWGGEDGVTANQTSYVNNVIQQAIVISERGPGDEKKEPTKPPRASRHRELSVELLQKHDTILNTSTRRLRRPSLSDTTSSSNSKIVPDPPRLSSTTTPQLPPMTPRTRYRKLGIPLAPPLPPTDPSPKSKVLSVAEKRRIRNEELLMASSGGLNFEINEAVDTAKFLPDWNDTCIDATRPSSQRSLLADKKVKESRPQHKRNLSDGQIAAQSHDHVGTSEFGDFASFDNRDAGPQQVIISIGSNAMPKQQSADQGRRQEFRRDEIAQRSSSLSRKKTSSRSNDLQGSSGRAPIRRADSPKSPRRRKLDLQHCSDELQAHLKNLFCDEKRSALSSSVTNSTHSESTSSSGDSGVARDAEKSASSTEVEHLRTTSFTRRAGRRDSRRSSLSNNVSDESVPISNRSSSVPRSSRKIKYSRNSNSKESNLSDISDARSSSAKSHGSLKSSKSSKSGRQVSHEEDCSANSSPRRRRPPTCPQSPMRSTGCIKEKIRTRSPVSKTSSELSSRRSGGKVNKDNGEVTTTPRSSGTQRRKIRYMKRSDGDDGNALPSIRLDSEE